MGDTRKRIALDYKGGEWVLPCGCALHYFAGKPDVDFVVPMSDTGVLVGVVYPHLHPCAKHEKLWEANDGR